MGDIEEKIRRDLISRKKGSAFGDLSNSEFDSNIYGTGSTEFSDTVVDDYDASSHNDSYNASGKTSTNPQHIIQQQLSESKSDIANDLAFMREQSNIANTRVIDKENDYKRRHREKMALSPDRTKALGGDDSAKSYADILREQELNREKEALLRKLQKQEQDKILLERAQSHNQPSSEKTFSSAAAALLSDDLDNRSVSDASTVVNEVESRSVYSSVADTPLSSSFVKNVDISATLPRASGVSRWDSTPLVSSSAFQDDTKSKDMLGSKRSRWEETPLVTSSAFSAPSSESRPQQLLDSRLRPLSDAELDAMLPPVGYRILSVPSTYKPITTPARKLLATPSPMVSSFSLFTDQSAASQQQVTETLTVAGSEGLSLRGEDASHFSSLLGEQGARPDDLLSAAEQVERRVALLLLRFKNGTPPQRKSAQRTLLENAVSFGADAIFSLLLPLFLSPALEEQERHLLVKLLSKLLFRLDDLVRPFAHKILVLVEPMLLDEDVFARSEARELISALAKAAGLPTMLAVLRPDVDAADEFVRNATARALAVVACALSIPALVPFLKAVCASKKAWEARHTGARALQQLATLSGAGILPFLKPLLETLKPLLEDKQVKVATAAALAVAAMAEAAFPFGIEAFDPVLRPLWRNLKNSRGRLLAASLKAVGSILPLMEAEYAAYYAGELVPTLTREFATADEDMKRVVLHVSSQMAACEGVPRTLLEQSILPEILKHFWTRRTALDHRVAQLVLKALVSLAKRIGLQQILSPVLKDLKDENLLFAKMSVNLVDACVRALGLSGLSTALEDQLLDGLLFFLQEQSVSESSTAQSTLNLHSSGDSMIGGGSSAAGAGGASQAILAALTAVLTALGARAKAYLPQLAGIIKWRLNNRSPIVRSVAAELVARLAHVFRACGETALLAHLSSVLYENLGEEFPDTLASLLFGLRGICGVMMVSEMTPAPRDLLPRLAPILRNRHTRVQEAAIDLCGRLASMPAAAAQVPAKEWMRVCIELLELLRAPRKAIRRATVNTVGAIAAAVGPQDVTVALLAHLRMQERQSRLCSAIAIAIVAETCAPFTVLPALMTEYRTQDLNVQNGVLKALAFLCCYVGTGVEGLVDNAAVTSGNIGSISGAGNFNAYSSISTDDSTVSVNVSEGNSMRAYVYAIAPLLADALSERDPVHRQTAASVVKHLALTVAGLGCQDVLIHLLNFVWPNILEESPHVIGTVMEAIEALRVALGPQIILRYVLQGLWHPNKVVRGQFWMIYNNLYVYGADKLTAAYPRIVSDPGVQVDLDADGKLAGVERIHLDKKVAENVYKRQYLDVFI